MQSLSTSQLGKLRQPKGAEHTRVDRRLQAVVPCKHSFANGIRSSRRNPIHALHCHPKPHSSLLLLLLLRLLSVQPRRERLREVTS